MDGFSSSCSKKISKHKGQVWKVDLGLAAKVRPCLLLTGSPSDEELALVTVVAHTTSLKDNPWELNIEKPSRLSPFIKSNVKKRVFQMELSINN